MAYTAIDDAGIFFNTKLYTGTGASNAQTGVGFQPDFTWIKNRDAADFHVLTDAVRGVTNYLVSDTNAGETTNAESLTGFDSDGFTVGTMDEVNTSTEAFVAWNWKANGAGAANSDGSITTTKTSANTTSGVSVVTYTGTGAVATIGHGLGAVPKMMIAKRLDTVNSWMVYNEALGNANELYLNGTNGSSGAPNSWNSTTPTSSVWSVATDANNTSGGTFVTYLFAEKTGFSKFGKYTGNGNADGTFVYTGFRPAFFLFKKTSAAGNNWGLFDNKRNTFNLVDTGLKPDANEAEYTTNGCDFLSNGVKMRSTGGDNNTDGATYIYMAFAESPFVNSEGVPTNAR